MDGRRISVDDDTWLVVPARSCHGRIRGAEDVHALTILFRRGMPEEVLGALMTAEDRLLDDGETRLCAGAAIHAALADSRSQRHAGSAVHPPALRHGP